MYGEYKPLTVKETMARNWEDSGRPAEIDHCEVLALVNEIERLRELVVQITGMLWCDDLVLSEPSDIAENQGQSEPSPLPDIHGLVVLQRLV